MADLPLYRKLYGTLLRHLSSYGTRLLLVELGDNNPHISMPELPAGYTTRALEPLDLLPWANGGYDLSEAFLRQSAARGDRCVANFYHDQLVGYGFVTPNYAAVTEQVAVAVSKNLLYRYKGWTHPQHRRKHLSHARGRLNSRLFPPQPGQRMVSYVEAQNFPSRLKHAEVRPVRLGYSLIVRLFGREMIFNSGVARRFGFRLVYRRGFEGMSQMEASV